MGLPIGLGVDALVGEVTACLASYWIAESTEESETRVVRDLVRSID